MTRLKIQRATAMSPVIAPTPKGKQLVSHIWVTIERLGTVAWRYQYTDEGFARQMAQKLNTMHVDSLDDLLNNYVSLGDKLDEKCVTSYRTSFEEGLRYD